MSLLKKPVVLLTLLLLVLAGGYLFSSRFTPPSFQGELALCNEVATELRFSCYRNALEKYYKGDLDRLTEELGANKALALEDTFKPGNDVSYANFGTNCHTFYHAVGDFIAENNDSEDLKSSVARCPSSCTSGCMMGLYKRTALENNFRTGLFKEFYDLCPADSKHQCAHEIGHNLHDKYSYSILKVLDEVSLKKYDLKQNRDYQYASVSKTDLNKPFEECKQVLPEKEWPYCFTGIGHNLFLFSHFSQDGYKSIFEECNGVEAANKDNCYAFFIYRVGINEAAPRFLSNKFDEGNKICDEVVSIVGREDMKKHCYLGLGGGIGLFVDSEYSSREISESNLAQVKEEILGFAKLCEKSQGDFRDNCFAGLMGTPFKKLYKNFGIYLEELEKLRPILDDDFQVVG